MSSLSDICKGMIAEAKKKNVFSGGVALFGDPNGEWNATILCPRGDGFDINLRNGNKRVSCWATEREQGMYASKSSKRHAGPIEDQIFRALSRLLPYPTLNQVYGIKRGGKIVTICYSVGRDEGTKFVFSDYTLHGETPSDIESRGPHGKYLDVSKWWRLSPVYLDKLIAGSKSAVWRAGKDKSGHDYFVLIDGSWTGVKGPALYNFEDGSPLSTRITLEEAQDLGGSDMRKNSHFSKFA